MNFEYVEVNDFKFFSATNELDIINMEYFIYIYIKYKCVWLDGGKSKNKWKIV